MITRRGLLQGGVALGAAAVLPVGQRSLGASAEPLVLTATTGVAPLVDDERPTRVWAYNASVPGPVIRATQGEWVRVRLRNRLQIPTTIHWHGIRIDNAMDGAGGLTQEPVAVGEQFDYAFRVPDAGTFWYHPHFRSAQAVAHGLYGALVVAERDPPAVDRDLLLVLDDWRLDAEQQIDVASMGNLHDAAHRGRLGNVLTVNGRPAPGFGVRRGERLRLRLLNAANSRVLRLDFGAFAPSLIALDGQPVTPRALGENRLTLASGQRADLLVDVDLGAGEVAELRAVTRGGAALAARFEAGEDTLRDEPLPAPVALAANPMPRELALGDALAVELRMEGGAMGGLAQAVFEGETLSGRELARRGQVWAFNGQVGMGEQPLFTVARGRTVRIAIDNRTRWAHGMHFHGHHVQVLGGAAHEATGDWRDTVLVDVGERAEFALHADNPGRWMLHCHMLEHQAAGMATWFEVA